MKRLHSSGAGRHSSIERVGAGLSSGGVAMGSGLAAACSKPPCGMPSSCGAPLLAKRLAIAATIAWADAADTPCAAVTAAAGAGALCCSPACKLDF